MPDQTLPTPIPLEEMCEARHDRRAGEWVTFRELPKGTGADGGRRIDVAAFNCWSSRKFYRVAYEVKRSRSDFLRELDQPDKRTFAETYFHETWFAVAPGVCSPAEVPDGWGLLVVTKVGTALRRARPARPREPEEMTPWLVAAILRRAYNEVEGIRERHFDFEGASVTAEEMQTLIEARVTEATKVRQEELRLAKTDATRALGEADRAQTKLEAPLRALAAAVAPYGQRDLTAENVRTWIAQCQQGLLRQTVRDLESAWMSLGRVLGKERS